MQQLMGAKFHVTPLFLQLFKNENTHFDLYVMSGSSGKVTDFEWMIYVWAGDAI